MERACRTVIVAVALTLFAPHHQTASSNGPEAAPDEFARLYGPGSTSSFWPAW